MGLTIHKEGMYCCAVCQAPYDSIRGLSTHVLKKHSMDARTYYDTHVKHGTEGTCPVCGKPTKFRSLGEGYKTCCSHECWGKYFSSDKEKVAKRNAKSEATAMSRYGVKNAGGSKEALEKANATNLAKRGVLYPTQSKEVIEKSKETCLSKYGATTYVHSAEGAERVTSTVMEKFNRSNFFSGKEGKEAARAGYLAKHGYDHNMHDPAFLEKWKTEQFDKNDGKYFVETDEFKDKSRETQFAHYGTWYSASTEGRKRYRDKMLSMFNVPEYFQSEEFKVKNRNTLQSKYGVNNYSQTPEWKEKYTATSLSRYGTEHPFQSDEVKAKSVATNLERYGVENFAQTPMWHEKAVSSSMGRWGVPYPNQSPVLKARTVERNMEKYGAEHYMKSMEYQNNVLARYVKILSEKSCELVGRPSHEMVTFRCGKCGNTVTEQVQLIKARVGADLTPCTCCMPKYPSVSLEESEVTNFVKSLGFSVEHYDRDFIGPYGADIVVESKKIIIEYDDIFWHSEVNKDSKYHLNKTLLAQEKGYQLIHIFSDEWIYSNRIVKSRLKHILGIPSSETVYARNCSIREISHECANEFIKKNHLQGNTGAHWRYGLFNGDSMVAVMTFGKSRFEDNAMELIRYCTDCNINVVGGAGKLFSYFINMHPEVNSITTYADARWSTSGAFYTKLGFTLEAMSDPGYFIIDGDIRRNRLNYQRHLIAKPGDEGKTEHQITLERGLFRIYDCGQYRYVWKRPVKEEQ